MEGRRPHRKAPGPDCSQDASSRFAISARKGVNQFLRILRIESSRSAPQPVAFRLGVASGVLKSLELNCCAALRSGKRAGSSIGAAPSQGTPRAQLRPCREVSSRELKSHSQELCEETNRPAKRISSLPGSRRGATRHRIAWVRPTQRSYKTINCGLPRNETGKLRCLHHNHRIQVTSRIFIVVLQML